MVNFLSILADSNKLCRLGPMILTALISFLLFTNTRAADHLCISRTHWRTEASFDALADIFETGYNSSYTLQGWYVRSSSTTNCANNSYFLYDNKQCLVVASDATNPGPYAKDIRAEWLNLPTPFSADLQAEPQEKQTAAVIAGRISLTKTSTAYYDGPAWIGCYLVWQKITRTLVPPSTNSDLLQALNAPEYCFGKWPTCINKKGIAQARLYIGKDIYSSYDTTIQIAGYLAAPCTKPELPITLFQPTLGSNGHWGWGVCGFINLPLVTIGQGSIGLYAMADNLYLLSRKELRMYDLYTKPLSRLIRYNDLAGQQHIPIVQTTTLISKVHPYNRAYVYPGLSFMSPHVQLVTCLSIFGRSQEKVVPLCPVLPTQAISGIGTQVIDHVTVGNSASKSVISYQAANDTVFTPFTSQDLAIESAVAPSCVQLGLHVHINIRTAHANLSAGLTYSAQSKYGVLCPVISWISGNLFW